MDVDRRIKIMLDEDEMKDAIINSLNSKGFSASKEDINLTYDHLTSIGSPAGVKCIALCTDIK